MRGNQGDKVRRGAIDQRGQAGAGDDVDVAGTGQIGRDGQGNESKNHKSGDRPKKDAGHAIQPAEIGGTKELRLQNTGKTAEKQHGLEHDHVGNHTADDGREGEAPDEERRDRIVKVGRGEERGDQGGHAVNETREALEQTEQATEREDTRDQGVERIHRRRSGRHDVIGESRRRTVDQAGTTMPAGCITHPSA